MLSFLLVLTKRDDPKLELAPNPLALSRLIAEFLLSWQLSEINSSTVVVLQNVGPEVGLHLIPAWFLFFGINWKGSVSNGFFNVNKNALESIFTDSIDINDTEDDLEYCFHSGTEWYTHQRSILQYSWWSVVWVLFHHNSHGILLQNNYAQRLYRSIKR